jgi:hypothetical protein
VAFLKVEVRKRPVADVAVPEATSASYLKRLAPRQSKAAGNGAPGNRAGEATREPCWVMRNVVRPWCGRARLCKFTAASEIHDAAQYLPPAKIDLVVLSEALCE